MRASLVELVKQYEQVPFVQSVKRPKTSLTEEYARDLIATLFVESIIWWLERGRPDNPEEMARRSGSLAFAIFRETNAW